MVQEDKEYQPIIAGRSGPNSQIEKLAPKPAAQGFINFAEDPIYLSIGKVVGLIMLFPLLIWYFIGKRVLRMTRWCLTGKPLFIVAKCASKYVKSAAGVLARPAYQISMKLWHHSSQLVKKAVIHAFRFALKKSKTIGIQMLSFTNRHMNQMISLVRCLVFKFVKQIAIATRRLFGGINRSISLMLRCLNIVLSKLKLWLPALASIFKMCSRRMNAFLSMVYTEFTKICKESLAKAFNCGKNILTPLWTALCSALRKLTSQIIKTLRTLISTAASRSFKAIRYLGDLVKLWIYEPLNFIANRTIFPVMRFVKNKILEKIRLMWTFFNKVRLFIWSRAKLISRKLKEAAKAFFCKIRDIISLAWQFVLGIFRKTGFFCYHKSKMLFLLMVSSFNSLSKTIIKQAKAVGCKLMAIINLTFRSFWYPVGSAFLRFANNTASLMLRGGKTAVGYFRSLYSWVYKIIAKMLEVMKDAFFSIAIHLKTAVLFTSRLIHQLATKVLSCLQIPLFKLWLFVHNSSLMFVKGAKTLLSKIGTSIVDQSAKILTKCRKTGNLISNFSINAWRVTQRVSGIIMAMARHMMTKSWNRLHIIVSKLKSLWNDLVVARLLIPLTAIIKSLVKSRYAKACRSIRGTTEFTVNACKAVIRNFQGRFNQTRDYIDSIRRRLHESVNTILETLSSTLTIFQNYFWTVYDKLSLTFESLIGTLNTIKRQMDETVASVKIFLESCRERVLLQAAGIKDQVGVTFNQLLNKISLVYA